MIKTVTPARAAEILREHGMRTSAETLKYGLTQNKFPFGAAIVSLRAHIRSTYLNGC